MTADFKQLIIFPLIIFVKGRSSRIDLLHFTLKSQRISAGLKRLLASVPGERAAGKITRNLLPFFRKCVKVMEKAIE